ncbi:hypothetical protein AMTRI_Chr04g182460 [Amborella trichopoda]
MAFAAPFSCSLLCFSPTNLSKTFLRPFNGNPTSNLCTTQRLLGRGIRNGRRYTEIIGVSESSSFLGSNEPAIKASGLGRDDGEELSKATLLWRAVKLPIYSVALVPLTVGGAAAYLQTGFFAARRYLVLLLASASIITWLNLSNDVYDYDTGADKDKKESVVNIFGSRGMTLYAAFAFLAFGFVGLVFASIEAGSIVSIMLLTGATMCGYAYQCPPFRLGYLGLGEPLCFIAFGPLATTAFYLSQRNKSVTVLLPLNGTVLSAAILVGITTSLILFCSHFHQIEGDLAVGKMSPLVQIGTEKGSKVVKFSILILYSFLFVLGALRALPLTCVVLCTLTLPIGKLVVDYVQDNHNDKTKIFMAKYYCVRLHALFGIALAIGLAMARRMAHFLNEGTRRSFVFRGSTWFLPFLLEFFRGT